MSDEQDIDISRSSGAAFSAQIEDDKTKRGKAKSIKPLRQLWPFIARYPLTLTLFLIALMVAAGLNLAMTLAAKVIVDCGFIGDSEPLDYCSTYALGGDVGSLTPYFGFAILIVLTWLFSVQRDFILLVC